MQRMQFFLVPGLLRQDAAHAVQQVLRLGLSLFWQLSDLGSDFVALAAHPDSVRIEGFAHALKLHCMGVAANLRGHAGRLSVVVL
jgi:hypothetical protein